MKHIPILISLLYKLVNIFFFINNLLYYLKLKLNLDPDLSHREVKNEDIDYQISVTTIFAYIAHFMVNLRLKGP